MRSLVLATCMLPAIASSQGKALPRFQPESLTVVFDKSAKYYQEYVVPETEKSVTRDLREVRLNSVRFPAENPLIISSQSFPNAASPYEALANFLFVSRAEDAAKVISLHDSTSKKLVEAGMQGPGGREAFFKITNAIQKVKVLTAFETKGLTIVYGYNVFSDRENLHPWIFVKENGRYLKKAGSIEIGFLQSLGGALQSEGTSLFKGKK